MDAFMSCEGEVRTETQSVTNNTHIQRNVGEAESKDRACSQVLSSLNTDRQFTAFLSQHGLIMSDGEISVHRSAALRVPARMLQSVGRSQRPPGAPCTWFGLLRYNEGAAAWLLRGRVVALQP